MNRSDHEPDDGNPALEQLVAYLDGELPADEALELEGQIAVDPALREEMNRMEMTWGLLDYLPRAEVDEAFTHSTINLVAQSAQEVVRLEQNLLPRQRQRQLLCGLGGIVSAGLAGFLVMNQFRPDPNEPLLRDLPLLQHLEQYRQVDDLEFLRLLKKKNLFPEDSSHGG